MLDDETIGFMAREFAAYPAPALKAAAARARLAKDDARFRTGQAIAQQGIPGKGVPACASGHGPWGEGNATLGPRLAGQNALYIRRQFAAYADETRQTARAALMRPAVAGLSLDEIEAVAYYYERIIE